MQAFLEVLDHLLGWIWYIPAWKYLTMNNLTKCQTEYPHPWVTV